MIIAAAIEESIVEAEAKRKKGKGPGTKNKAASDTDSNRGVSAEKGKFPITVYVIS